MKFVPKAGDKPLNFALFGGIGGITKTPAKSPSL
jgi:hypothetical protein